MPVTKDMIDQAVAMLRNRGATRVILFGSASRAPAEALDLDLACDGISGWEFFEAAAELEERLPVAIDLLALSPPTPLSRHIEQRGRLVYGRR